MGRTKEKRNEILIIEDSRTINNIVKAELGKMGFSLSQAFSYKEAKKLLEEKEFS